MILTYSFPAFKPKILSGEKKHSLRRDPKNRWRVGMTIQHWMGSPRNTHAKIKPECFGEGVCKGLQQVILYNDGGLVRIAICNGPLHRELSDSEVSFFIANDGLSPEAFTAYFIPNPGDTWSGKIIHFTDNFIY